MTRTRRPAVQFTAGQALTVTQVAYVAELEARTIRLRQLVDEDLADELARERNRTLNLRRRVDELKAELRHAQMVGRWLRHRNQRLLAFLRTIHPRKEPTR